MRMNLVNSVACAVGALLLVGLATEANAASVLCLSANAAEPGESALALYGNGYCSGSYGVGLNYYPSDSSTLTTNPDPMPVGLTTAGFVLTSFGDSASASASLETATLTASASSEAGTQANANAVFSEGLTFTITDGAPSASITVYIHLAGGQTGTEGVYGNGFDFNFAGARFSYYTRSNPPGFGYPPCCTPTGITLLTENLTDSGFDISGTVDVTDGESTTILMVPIVDCRGGESCSYTATFNWDLPSNVTVTSDSGVFLSQ